MRKKIALLVVPAAITAILVVISPTSAISKPQTVSLRGLPERFEPLEGFSAEGLPSTGARAIFTERLHQLKGGKVGARVGRTERLCTVIGTWGNSHRAPAYCTTSYTLPAGKILDAGFGPFPVGPGEQRSRSSGAPAPMRTPAAMSRFAPTGIQDEQRDPSSAVTGWCDRT